MGNICRMCNKNINIPMNVNFLISFKKSSPPILCDECYEKFEFIQSSLACRGCSKPLDKAEYCEDCLKWKEIYPDMYVSHTSIYSYNNFAKDWMKQLKFTGDIYLAESLSKQVKSVMTKHVKEKLVIPIPSSSRSLEDRGFNQIEVILEFAKITYSKYLVHIGNTKRQATKNRKERLQTKQHFALDENYKKKVKNAEILLFDDVYTTGRTLYHARECLYKAGAKEVSSLTIFR